jgi:hypothetical protein
LQRFPVNLLCEWVPDSSLRVAPVNEKSGA